MNRLALLPICLAVGCARAPAIPGTETPFLREQLALASAAPHAPPRPHDEAKKLREAAAKLEPIAAADAERQRTHSEVEGLVDLDAAGARDFVAAVSDLEKGDEVISKTPLGVETVPLAAYARSPEIRSAEASWRAAGSAYEQATYLEDVLLRYRAFAREAPSGASQMRMGESMFPYPGTVALKGEMIARDVAIAREQARQHVLQVLVRAAKAHLGAVHHEEEVRLRREQLTLADRLLAAATSRARGGLGVQAELLEAQSERAEASNQLDHAAAALPRYLAELNATLDRAPSAPLTLTPAGEPPSVTPPVESMLAMARRFSPEIRIARAEVERADFAIRMAEAQVFVPPAPGAVARPSAMTPDMGAVRVVPGTQPMAVGGDLAWVAELRARREALSRGAEAAVRTAEQGVATARFDMDAGRRMNALAIRSTIPLSKQALDERIRLYESGRGTFAELVAAYRRLLEAQHDALAGRYDYFEAETELWEAAGARPSVALAAPTAGGAR